MLGSYTQISDCGRVSAPNPALFKSQLYLKKKKGRNQCLIGRGGGPPGIFLYLSES